MSYNYLAPLIFPLLPKSSGITYIDLPMAALIDDAGLGLSDGQLTATIDRFEQGQRVGEPDVIDIQVTNGAPNLAILSRCFEPEALGFVAVSLESNVPFFRKITTEIVNSIVERPDGSAFNVSANSKYAEPPVIKQIQATQKFCIVHTGNYVSRAQNAGNSTIIINPFDGPLVAKLTSESGKEIKQRINADECAWISLESLLNDSEWGGVMYTGSNRYPAWDVRHDLDNPEYVHHVDHLEYYRGEETKPVLSIKDFAKAATRDLLRFSGVRVG